MTNPGALAVSEQGAENQDAVTGFVSHTNKSNSAGIYESMIQ